jgi:hypothetical protein
MATPLPFDDSVVTMQVLELDNNELPTAMSLLGKLASPITSDGVDTPSRARKIPSIGKKRSLGGSSSKDPKVHPSQRIREFPNEGLKVSDDGKLVCKVCQETLSMKKSTLSSHFKSTKHVAAKAKVGQVLGESTATAVVRKCDESKPMILTVPDDAMVYQINVLKAFLSAGVPISKLPCLKGILGEHAAELTQLSLLKLLPIILEEEKIKIIEEVQGKYMSVMFEASDIFAVVIRYVDKWKIHHRLIQMECLPKCLTSEEVAHRIIDTLSASYGVEPDLLVAAIVDGETSNCAAVGVVKGTYPQIMDINCFSYHLDLVCIKFKTPILHSFITYWTSLFVRSPNARMRWKAQTGTAIASYGKMRWWGEWETVRQLTLQFDDIEPFLDANTDIGPSDHPKLLEILHSTSGLNQLKMELAAVFDIGEHFTRAMYNLDSEGSLMVNCYEEIVRLLAVLNTGYHPNIETIAQSLAPGNVIAQQQWISYAMSCIQPGLDYFRANFGDDSKPPLSRFKAMRYFAPARIFEIQPSATDIDSLTTLSFLNNPLVIASLKAELPAYLARASDVSITTDLTDWWKKNQELLPNWSLAAQRALVLQPSCSAMERVTSLWNSFKDYLEKDTSSGYTESSIILQYNDR